MHARLSIVLPELANEERQELAAWEVQAAAALRAMRACSAGVDVALVAGQVWDPSHLVSLGALLDSCVLPILAPSVLTTLTLDCCDLQPDSLDCLKRHSLPLLHSFQLRGCRGVLPARHIAAVAAMDAPRLRRLELTWCEYGGGEPASGGLVATLVLVGTTRPLPVDGDGQQQVLTLHVHPALSEEQQAVCRGMLDAAGRGPQHVQLESISSLEES
jgi:hypothetical protein